MRLSKITTRVGDAGETTLATGQRVHKDSLRIIVLGEVDELNACLGLLAAEALPEAEAALCLTVQHHLFDLGAEIAMVNQDAVQCRFPSAHLDVLEEKMAHYQNLLPPLREFILPGGNRPAALAHLARTVCRRAERQLWRLTREEGTLPHLPQYLNRLSDILFMVARVLARQSGQEVYWQAPKS
jgi:cob(I)alamin adenosyltransferase